MSDETVVVPEPEVIDRVLQNTQRHMETLTNTEEIIAASLRQALTKPFADWLRDNQPSGPQASFAIATACAMLAGVLSQSQHEKVDGKLVQLPRVERSVLGAQILIMALSFSFQIAELTPEEVEQVMMKSQAPPSIK